MGHRRTGTEVLATAANWCKWRPSDPTPAHWYSLERLENLVASYIAAERTGTKPRTVREFVSEFRGLSSTAKQKQVVARANLDRVYLHDLLGDARQLNRPALQRLLFSMQQASAPVKPDSLGVLGEAHFRKILASVGDEATFPYRRVAGTTEEGLPYIAEGAFSMTDRPLHCGAHVGLNWSVPLSKSASGKPLRCRRGLFGMGFVVCEQRLYGSAEENGIQISMSRKAHPWDNAACESFMKTLKYEEVYRIPESGRGPVRDRNISAEGLPS